MVSHPPGFDMPPRGMPSQAGAKASGVAVGKAHKRGKDSADDGGADGEIAEGFAEIYEQNVKEESPKAKATPQSSKGTGKTEQDEASAETRAGKAAKKSEEKSGENAERASSSETSSSSKKNDTQGVATGDRTHVRVSLNNLRDTAPYMSRDVLGMHPLETAGDEKLVLKAQPKVAPDGEAGNSSKTGTVKVKEANPELAQTLPSFTRRFVAKDAKLPKDAPAEEELLPPGFTSTKSGRLVATRKWEGKVEAPKKEPQAGHGPAQAGNGRPKTATAHPTEELSLTDDELATLTKSTGKGRPDGGSAMQDDAIGDKPQPLGDGVPDKARSASAPKPVEVLNPDATNAAKPTNAPKVTNAPKPTNAPKVTNAAKPTNAPKVTNAAKPKDSVKAEGQESLEAPKPVQVQEQEVVTVRPKAQKARQTDTGMPDKVSNHSTDVMSTMPISRASLGTEVYGTGEEVPAQSRTVDAPQTQAVPADAANSFPVLGGDSDDDGVGEKTRVTDVRMTQEIPKEELEQQTTQRSTMLYRGESPKEVQRPAVPEKPADVKVTNMRYEAPKNSTDSDSKGTDSKGENPLQQLERKAMPPQPRPSRVSLKGIPVEQGLKPAKLESIEVTSTINLPRGVSALKQELASRGKPAGKFRPRPQRNALDGPPHLVNDQSAPEAAKAQAQSPAQSVPRMHALQELVRMIQDHIQTANTNGTDGARMMMDFSSTRYGNVSITLQQESGQLHIVLKTETDSSKQELLDQRDELARQLRQLGYQDVDVEIEGRADTEKQRQDEERQQENLEKNIRFVGDEGEMLDEL